VTATVSAALALVLAAPASAEVIGEEGGFIYVKREKTLPGGGPGEAVVTAKCPDGAAHTGGGASVTGKLTGTALASSGASTDRQWYVEGWHTGINSENETLTSWLICTEKAGKISDESNPVNVGPPDTGGHSVAECSEGHAVGGGVRSIGNPSDWWLNATSAVDGADSGEVPNDGWVTWMHHPAGATHTFITDVVCMTGKEPIYRSKDKTTEKKKVTKKVLCPKGTSVTGGGAFASAATEDSHVTFTGPIDSKKDNDKTPDDGWKATFFNDNSVNQKFTASAVCK
jgi:hypothetical protein